MISASEIRRDAVMAELSSNAHLTLFLTAMTDMASGSFAGPWAFVELSQEPGQPAEPCLVVRLADVIRTSRSKLKRTRFWDRLPEKISAQLRSRLETKGLLMASGIERKIQGRRVQRLDAIRVRGISDDPYIAVLLHRLAAAS